jgi:alpha-tubulin suppressor-like RCC1 family protein
VRIDATGLPVIAAAFSPASADSAGSTCAVRPTGEGYCWGLNSDGQLGDGTNITRLTPAKIAAPANIRLVTVSAKAFHGCGLDEVGQAWCWGNNADGRLGNNSSINSNTPVEVAGGRSFISISAGVTHTCAIEYGGAAWCWGKNDHGQLGEGSGQSSAVPTRVSSGQSFRSVEAGDWHTCGLSTSGVVYCWGGNDFGQIGDGTQTQRATPVQTSTAQIFASLTAGGKHNCAITSGGGLFCWGRGGSGQLGRGTFDHSFVPVQITGVSGVASVRGGNHHTCAVTASGGSWCWGLNSHGQVGSGSKSPANVLVPTAVAGLPGTAREMAAGVDHSCSLLVGGQIWCWGQNKSGQLGDGTTTSRLTPVAVAGGITFGAISAGGLPFQRQ